LEHPHRTPGSERDDDDGVAQVGLDEQAGDADGPRQGDHVTAGERPHEDDEEERSQDEAVGCHGSNSSSLPMLQHRAAVATMASTPATGPAGGPQGGDADDASRSGGQLPRPAGPVPNSFTGAASRSNSSGPGLLKFVSVPSDAEVHVPSSGWCSCEDVPGADGEVPVVTDRLPAAIDGADRGHRNG
jgi:hypothetical protein